LRKIWGQTDNPEEIIKKLEYYTDAYISICIGKYPDKYGKLVRFELDKLVRSNSPTSIHPFVIRLLKEYELGNVTEKNTAECLATLESFLVRRAISGIEPTGLLATFRTAWGVMEGKPTKENLTEVINKRNTVEWPDDDRLTKAILSRNIYSSHICEYILLEYERSLGSDIPNNKFWIEHVMPQKLNKQWLNVINEEDHQSLVHTWGNLIPLTKEMNQEVSQSEFSKKKKHFEKHSVFASARTLANEHHKWDKETIINRSSLIAKWAIKRWAK
jgi:hypothetical protein